MNLNRESLNPIPSVHFTPWGQLSGAQRSLLGLVQEQVKFQPTGVLCLHNDSVAVRARELGARVLIHALDQGGDYNETKNLSLIRDFVAELGAKILHCHSAFGMKYILEIARECKLKIVCHQRDNFKEDDFHRDLKYADKIIAISEAVFNTLPNDLRNRSDVVYNETHLHKRIVETKNGRIVIGMAGRSIAEKGMHLFLDGVIPLMSSYDFDVCIWGLRSSRYADISQSVIERVSRLPNKLKARFQLENFREDIEEFYKIANVVVVPSVYPEPFGRMALESMSQGRITIVAGHGGLIEIVEDGVTGLVFIPGDSQSLQKQLETALLDKELCVNIMSNGPDRALSKFSPKKHYQKIQEVYESVLSND